MHDSQGSALIAGKNQSAEPGDDKSPWSWQVAGVAVTLPVAGAHLGGTARR